MSDADAHIPMLPPSEALSANDTRLVDVVDRLLDHGVVVRGELWLTVADVDLLFIGVDLVLASPERMAPAGSSAVTGGRA